MFQFQVQVLFWWNVFLGVSKASYPLTGVHTGIDSTAGARPARRNILDFQNDVPAWSLYIQALIEMQQLPEDDMLSWFQIAGIHGRPFYAWDGVKGNSTCPETGYCPHYIALFPTWHRAYIALFEQVLAGRVQSIAKGYNSSLYQAAADNFRVPYWDWASIPTMPPVVNGLQVLITTPSGPANVTNPLLLYKFQQFPLNSTWFPPDQVNEGQIVTYPTTLRAPDLGLSSPKVINANLGGSSLMQFTHDAFKCKDYNRMATSRTQSESFEYTHNLVHHTLGGYNPTQVGHMFTSSYAAFDPIFFLHHVNLDRLLTLWMAVNPSSFLAMAVDEDGSFTNPAGGNISASTPLTPFSKRDGSLWTSLDVRDISVLGYSYPEVQDWTFKSKLAMAENVKKTVEGLYNPGGPFTKPNTKELVSKLWN